MKGTKNDGGKARYDLVSPAALDDLVKVLTFGASKYGDYDWQKGLSYSRVFAAVQRHLWAWWNSEEDDKESGLSHLAHAQCRIHFLQYYVKNNYGKFDDRVISVPKLPQVDTERVRETHWEQWREWRCLCSKPPSGEHSTGLCIGDECVLFDKDKPCRYSGGLGQ